MKVSIVSDIHIDHYRREYSKYSKEKIFENIKNEEKSELLIIAGDISSGSDVLYTLEELTEYYPEIVFVRGNHDFWRNHFSKRILPPESSPHFLPNVHELEREIFTLKNGRRILGCTLWTECGPDSKYAPYHYRCMMDLTYMEFPPLVDLIGESPDNAEKLWVAGGEVEFLLDDFRKSKQWLEETIREGDIVVTHHLPSYSCVHPKYANDILTNSFFASDLDYLIEKAKPEYWIHGHTHSPNSFKIFDTTILCNPRGYPREASNRYTGYSPIQIEI